MMEQPIALDAVAVNSDQLVGWIYARLQGGQVVDAAEWNRALTTLGKPLELAV